MNATTLIKPCGIGNFECLALGENGHELFVGDGERLNESGENSSLVLIAPAESISLREVAFDASERKMLRQTLPYSLEDDLVDDVDGLHFALGELNENSVPLAIIRREALQKYLDDIREQGVEIEQLVPELQLIPVSDNSWTLLVDAGQAGEPRWLLRYSAAQGFAMEGQCAALAMQLLVDESAQPPEKLLIYCQPEQRSEMP